MVIFMLAWPTFLKDRKDWKKDDDYVCNNGNKIVSMRGVSRGEGNGQKYFIKGEYTFIHGGRGFSERSW